MTSASRDTLPLLAALTSRVVVADGAMGTMLQAAEHTGSGLDLERDFQRELGRSSDFREGVTAFIDKRAPRFTGQ